MDVFICSPTEISYTLRRRGNAYHLHCNTDLKASYETHWCKLSAVITLIMLQC